MKDIAEAVKCRNDARTDRKPAGTINFTADTKQEVEQMQTSFNHVKWFWGEGKCSFVSSKVVLEEVLQFSLQETLNCSR